MTNAQYGGEIAGQSEPVQPRGLSTRRYLRYDEDRPVAAGINHQLSNLRCLLVEAHATGRLAILPALRLEARHNFDIPGDWAWDTYFDLDASRLVTPCGQEHALPFVRELPAGTMNTHTIAPGGPWCVSAETAQLVVRQVRHQLFAREVPATKPAPVLVLRPSATVLDLARPVIETLRTRWPAGYAGVHIRRGDRLWGPIKWLMRPESIRRRLQKLGVHEGASVFFLSDERDAAFWSALTPHYEVVRYTDFPELAELVTATGGGMPDNYLLFEVEKEIMRHAAMRVETFPIAGQPSEGTLVPKVTWFIAQNLQPVWRAATLFKTRGIRKSAKLVTMAMRRVGITRSSSGG